MTDKIKGYEDEHAVNSYRLRFKGDACAHPSVRVSDDGAGLCGICGAFVPDMFEITGTVGAPLTRVTMQQVEESRDPYHVQNGGDEPPVDGFYRVKIRKDLAQVKEGAHLIDGKVFEFKAGWQVDTGTLYVGEWAMMPVDLKSWPHESCISWIASGDLEYAGENDTPNYTREELVEIMASKMWVNRIAGKEACKVLAIDALDALIALDAVRVK